jgi:hypothetical protein
MPVGLSAMLSIGRVKGPELQKEEKSKTIVPDSITEYE